VKRHNHQMIFGQLETGCPRCDELKAGAPIRQAPWFKRARQRKAALAHELQAIQEHDFVACSKKHIACTHFDW